MLKSFLPDRDKNEMTEFLVEKGWYKKVDGGYSITVLGMVMSDDSDYLHGNGKPYLEGKSISDDDVREIMKHMIY